MAVPTPDWTYNDLTDAGFSSSGTPTEALGQHSASNTTYDFDHTNDARTHTDKPWAGASSGSMSFWSYSTDNTATNYAFAQRLTTSAADFWYMPFNGANGDVSFNLLTSSTSNKISTSTINAHVPFEWEHWIVTWDINAASADSCQVYRNGVNLNITCSITGTPVALGGSLDVLNVGGLYSNNHSAGVWGGRVDRINFWDDVVLTDGAEGTAKEHFDAEVSAAYVPETTFSTNDFTSGWTELGTVAYVADNINTTCSLSYSGDGSTSALVNAAQLLTEGGGVFSMSCWLKTPDTSGGSKGFFGQSRLGANQGAQFKVNTLGQVQGLAYSAASGAAGAHSTGAGVVDDDAWHHVVISFNDDKTANVNVITDGVATYASKDTVIGAGWSTLYASGGETSIGSAADTVFVPLDGEVARLRIWNTSFLSAAQAKVIYDTEFALIGTDPDCPVVVPAAPASSGVSRTGIGLNSWFTGGRRKRRRRRR